MKIKYNKECPICNGINIQNGTYTEICKLNTSTVFLFKEQTYYGRAVVVLNTHEDELYHMDENLRNEYFAEVVKTAQAIQKATGAQKINYGAFGDKIPHVHFHLVPKYEGKEDFGGLFRQGFEGVRYLDGDEKQELIDKIRNEIMSRNCDNK